MHKAQAFFLNYYTLLNSDFLVSETEIALLSKGIRCIKKLQEREIYLETLIPLGLAEHWKLGFLIWANRCRQ